MTVECLLQRSSKGDDLVRAFAQGCGGTVSDNLTWRNNNPPDGRPFFIWGQLRGSDLVLRRCLDTGYPFFYGDNPYWGPKNHFRVTAGGLQNTRLVERDDARLKKNPAPAIQPWKKDGKKIILLPPSIGFARFFGQEGWVAEKYQALRQVTDRPIEVRRKPGEVGIAWEDGYMVNAGPINYDNATTKPIEEDLKDARAVVAFQSAAVNAAIAAGVPAFVDSINAATILGNTDVSQIETPVYGDREAYFRHLSYCQFTPLEFQNGTAWDILSETSGEEQSD